MNYHPDDTAALPCRVLLALLWTVLFTIFFALRFDSSERTYFQIDDQVVVWLVDDAVNNGNWQPDWYRAGSKALPNSADAIASNIAAGRDLPHDHHYNFSAHMLLSAAVIKPLRVAGLTTTTIVLLHHIATAWDAISLLFLIAAAWQLGGQRLALCGAIIYTVFPLTVQGSHYARPDALLTAMGSVLLWLALQKNRMTHWSWLLANGAAVGLATGGKASQLMLGIFPALACSAALFNHKQHPEKKSQEYVKTLARIGIDGMLILTVVIIVLALMFQLGNMSARDFLLSVQSIQLYYQHPQPPDTLEHYSFAAQLFKILHYFYATLGWPLILALAAGFTALLQKAEKLPLLLLSIPLAFFILYFSSLPAFFDRSFCALASGMVLLAAIGICASVDGLIRLPAKLFFSIAITLLACWKPIYIQYHLQTQHLREHHNVERLAFQQQLKKDWSARTGSDFWFKNIDTSDLFSQTLPEKPPKNPRIYIAEDMNDWNSREYLEKLRQNGFVQIAKFEGDFADMPTNSLITVHEAARFVYFVRTDDMPASPP